MTNEEYLKQALMTANHNFDAIRDRGDNKTIALLHAALGLCTESGEFADGIKRKLFYGKDIDRVNLIEELSDISWYLAVACDALGVSISEVFEANVLKLRKRYGDKFTEDAAINRNLSAERQILENGKKEEK